MLKSGINGCQVVSILQPKNQLIGSGCTALRSNKFRRHLIHLTQSNFYEFHESASGEKLFEFMPALTKAVFSYWCEQLLELKQCPGWENSTVKQLAQTMVDRRNYDNTPVLADALEETGYQDGAILFHLRDKKHCSVSGLQFHSRCELVMNIARYIDLWTTQPTAS